MRYIGSKTKLLKNIENIIKDNTKNCNFFFDMFGGTGIVGKYFKKHFEISSNDIMFYSYVLINGNVENNIKPEFKNLKEKHNIVDVIKYLNELNKEYNEENYIITNNYTQKKSERMYFTIENGIKIDSIRQEIEKWKKEQLIDYKEYFYLIALLIEAVPYVSNITGTYGAFLKNWDKRSFKTLELKELELIDNNKNNRTYNENANNLIKTISGDILYIDPPYTNIEYSSAYHVLESIAKYDNVEIKGITGQRIYNDKKSKYCKRKEAKQALLNLIKDANFRYIVISYIDILPTAKAGGF